MAKSRLVNTKFWTDNYAADLDPIEKLLFLYFITNPSTNICGIYELPLKDIAVQTGIDKEMVAKILCRFERDGKIFYRGGWVAIKNFIKNQNERSPKVKTGIEAELEKVPMDIKDLLFKTEKTEGINTLSHLNSNSNINSNSNPNAEAGASGKVVNDLISLFEPVNPMYGDLFANRTERKAVEVLVKTLGQEKVQTIITGLPAIINRKFAPKVTRPTELKRDLGKLIAFYNQEKSKNQNIIGIAL